MAYYSGSAVDMAAVRSALVSACTSEGWSWDGSGEVLSKGVLYLRLRVVSGYLELLGRTSASAGDAPSVVRMGQLAATSISYPVAYEIFVFDWEVYVVINYSIDYYQWCAFGRSIIEGLPGSGMWLGATLEANNPTGISITGSDGVNTNNTITPAIFWATSIQVGSRNRNCYVHSGLDSEGWNLTISGGTSQVGITQLVPLIGLLPSAWNSEAVLLPVRCYKQRPSQKVSLVADLQHARYTRVDNYAPGQIINIGSDRWKIFPWYLKNTAARAGGSEGISHTGTFGWAIRYEGA
ncbi:hypothetical protein CW360_14220 [Pseudomonas fluvialis]|uniref:Uncharacterized protein n=1 Tax=Pseudomonas fluvialis TaxID=1793966 RepID=A0A2I0CMR1_9PSED|nr:hypothetical protein [Pseudomonas pharmacofabricae]PKF70448.1 hypothetical protein CW360_14220 [Pseudomonas pharmacofabricae]